MNTNTNMNMNMNESYQNGEILPQQQQPQKYANIIPFNTSSNSTNCYNTNSNSNSNSNLNSNLNLMNNLNPEIETYSYVIPFQPSAPPSRQNLNVEEEQIQLQHKLMTIQFQEQQQQLQQLKLKLQEQQQQQQEQIQPLQQSKQLQQSQHQQSSFSSLSSAPPYQDSMNPNSYPNINTTSTTSIPFTMASTNAIANEDAISNVSEKSDEPAIIEITDFYTNRKHYNYNDEYDDNNINNNDNNNIHYNKDNYSFNNNQDNNSINGSINTSTLSQNKSLISKAPFSHFKCFIGSDQSKFDLLFLRKVVKDLRKQYNLIEEDEEKEKEESENKNEEIKNENDNDNDNDNDNENENEYQKKNKKKEGKVNTNEEEGLFLLDNFKPEWVPTLLFKENPYYSQFKRRYKMIQLSSESSVPSLSDINSS